LALIKNGKKFIAKSQTETEVKKTVNNYNQILLALEGGNAASFLTKNVDNMNVFPVEVYLIDSASFKSINDNTDIFSLLKPIKESTYYFFEGKDFIRSQVLIYHNGSWNPGWGGGMIFNETFVPKLKEVLIEKHLQCFTIKLHLYGSYNLYYHTFVDETGKLMWLSETYGVLPISHAFKRIPKNL